LYIGQSVTSRRLAGAVGPEEADDLAGIDVEIDPVDHPAATVVLDEPVDR